MRRRGRLFGARRGRFKRSVGWIDGFSGFDGTNQARGVSMVPIVTGSSIQGAAIRLVAETDIRDHGGEDCVLERIRGRFFLFNGLQGVGGTPTAAAFPMRVLVVQQDVVTEATGSILGVDYTTAEGLGRDNILWSQDVIVSGSSIYSGFLGANTDVTTINSFWTDIDVRAKRKVQIDREITLWFQTPIGALTPNLSFRFQGLLRMLLKRPR